MQQPEKIELPDSLFGIGGFSFYGCAKLEGVTIPDSVMHIDMGAFSNCTGIKSVTIPKNVTRIGSYAFGYSYDFETFNAVKDEDFTMIGYKKTDAETYAKDNGFEFTALDAASIINLGVCGENLTWTLESDGLLTISGMGDMYDYDLSLSPWYDDRDEIKNVEIGNGVTNIGSDAFAFCSNIESVIIPYGVTSIGSSAFSLCSEITEINIPDSVMTIGDHAFMGCTGIKDLTLGKSVMSIGKGAFYACMGLESITIPYSVTSIGDEAFTDCAELKNVTIPDSVTEIGKQALGYYTGTNDKLVKFKDFTITGYKDTAAEKYAADNGFEFVAITGEEAVDSGVCGENLTWKIDQKGTLTISGTGDMDDMSAICPWYEHYYDIRKVVIEDGVTSIGAGAFAYCTELESVTIPDSVKSVGAQAFNLCTSLAGVTIPDSVTSIGDQAFNCCMSLNSVTIGNGVKSIGEKAFYECYELIDVAVPDSVESIGSQALGYYHNYDNNEEEKTEGFTIAGSKNTAAEKYAADNGFAFSAAGESVFGDINGDNILNVNDLVLM